MFSVRLRRGWKTRIRDLESTGLIHQQERTNVTDREVQAISQFLREFGYLGCFDIAQRRADRDITKMSEEQVAQKVLDIREAWRQEGLDVDRLYAVALMAHHYHADRYKCLPACCRPWGEIKPVMPPGRGSPLTMAQLDRAMAGAVLIPGTNQKLIDSGA